MVQPETPLTFQVTAPVTIETNNAPQAFRFVNSADYPPEQIQQPQQAPAYPTPPPYPYPYPYYAYAAPSYPYYPYYGYPYFYGPSFTFFFGFPAYYHYHGYYGGHYGYGYAPRPVPYHGGIIAYTYHGGAHH